MSEKKISEVNEQLIAAVKNLNLKEVQKALQDGADPNIKTEEGNPLLMVLVSSFPNQFDSSKEYNEWNNKVLNIGKVLLEAKANVNAKNNDGRTVLHVAMWDDRTDFAFAKLLTEHGVDVNAADNAGETPLMYAARNGNISNVNELINAGADVNAIDNDGYNVWNYALSCRNEDAKRKIKNVIKESVSPEQYLAFKRHQLACTVDEATRVANYLASRAIGKEFKDSSGTMKKIKLSSGLKKVESKVSKIISKVRE